MPGSYYHRGMMRAAALLALVSLASAQDGWIQEDIKAGYARARATGKPLLVAFR